MFDKVVTKCKQTARHCILPPASQNFNSQFRRAMVELLGKNFIFILVRLRVTKQTQAEIF